VSGWATVSVAACGVAALCACTPYDDQTQTLRVPAYASGRFEVHIDSAFDDGLAYHGRRAIYIIKDTQTGIEYVGVSGIGVSELGSHAAGKARVTDER
jgi:hypothetical protein